MSEKPLSERMHLTAEDQKLSGHRYEAKVIRAFANEAAQLERELAAAREQADVWKNRAEHAIACLSYKIQQLAAVAPKE